MPRDMELAAAASARRKSYDTHMGVKHMGVAGRDRSLRNCVVYAPGPTFIPTMGKCLVRA